MFTWVSDDLQMSRAALDYLISRAECLLRWTCAYDNDWNEQNMTGLGYRGVTGI